MIKKYFAKLTKWNGEVIEQEIKKEWIDDLVCAVQGQYSFFDKVRGFGIKGGDYIHIDVYERNFEISTL